MRENWKFQDNKVMKDSLAIKFECKFKCNRVQIKSTKWFQNLKKFRFCSERFKKENETKMLFLLTAFGALGACRTMFASVS